MVQQEGLSSVSFRLTAPSAEGAEKEPVWRLCNRPLKTFAQSPLQLMAAQRWQVAAALSAAVTTTNQQETAPNLQAEPSQKKRPTPNASRSSGEGVWGEALLSEKRPLPQNLPHT